MKYLYKYPQAAFPYADLVETNKRRSRHEMEYELLDTGVFDGDRYFDVFVEYAKASPEDILVRITVENRGPEPATLHVLPTLWFRNTWSWGGEAPRPALRQAGPGRDRRRRTPSSGRGTCPARAPPRCSSPRTRPTPSASSGAANRTPFVKDGIDRCIVHGQRGRGESPAAGHQGGRALSPHGGGRPVADDPAAPPRGRGRGALRHAASTRSWRRAGRRPTSSTPPSSRRRSDADAANVMRQALAGMLWSKQFYHYDVDRWLEERGAAPFEPKRAPPPATSTGITWTTPTSSRCRTSGNTRGTRRGTWPSTSSP